ncbi:MAG TPA: tetratricopeptide repeat protein [Phycisphaerae bacterium]|nr:tetratricopeptide repeat protein [Phycisphaerae bacterium]
MKSSRLHLTPGSPSRAIGSWPRQWFAGAAGLIVAATVVAYLPAMRGGFLWDDDAHVTKPELRSAQGLYRIWFEVGATQQYYPLLHTAFWIQHKLWGDRPMGYHLVNLAWHAVASILVLVIVRRLLWAQGVGWADPGAVLTAAVFALHPVHVESVAWITEQKNTLSAVFYLSAMLAYLRFDETRLRSLYVLATALFLLGLLTKTVTATLPAALLVILWWKRGRLSWKREVAPLLPWLLLGGVSGLFTAWVEHDLIGAKGAAFEFAAVERLLLAGRVVSFYLYKLCWPAELIFIYPRWNVDPAAWRQWLFPLGLIAVLGVLLFYARRNRAPLAATLLFVGSLFPVLGFFNVFPFLYSFVADHFQYLPSLSVIALICGSIVAALWRIRSPAVRALPMLALPVVLGILTFRQCRMYADVQTLYETTIRKNPACWMAYNNLGILFKDRGQYAEAIGHYRRTLELRPQYSQAHNNLGVALTATGRYDEAIAAFAEALRLRPANPEALGNLAAALTKAGRFQEAISRLQEALRLDPDDAGLHSNLGVTLQAAGRPGEAAAEFRRALELAPDLPGIRAQLELGLAAMQPPESAIRTIEQLVRADPNNAQAHFSLAVALAQTGRLPDAIEHYQAVVRMNPDHIEAHNNLAALLARTGRLQEAIPHFEQAVRLKPDHVEMHMNLAVAYSSAGRYPDALATAQRARELAHHSGQMDLVQRIDTWIESCRARAGTDARTRPPI